MGEQEKKSSGVVWIVVALAVVFLGLPCVAGVILTIVALSLPLVSRTREPARQDRMQEMPMQVVPNIPEMPKLPEIPDLGTPGESKSPGE